MQRMTSLSLPGLPRVALIGDRADNVLAHQRIPVALAALARAGHPVDSYWLGSTAIGPDLDVAGFDGIWVLPGTPYADANAVLRTITAARTRGIPLLGTCGGFQHMLLEFAREVCGLDARHAESDPDADAPLLRPLVCSLMGEEDRVHVAPDTLAAHLLGAGPSTQRYFCSYGLDEAQRPVLEAHGLRISGTADDGAARIAELPDHPFALGTLFQPSLASDATFVHPVIAGFVAAVQAHADRGTAVA